jgi:hypothetical protein
LRSTPNLEEQVSVFMTQNDHLYPQATGSLFVVFYGSKGDGGGILNRLHMGHFYIIIIIYKGA